MTTHDKDKIIAAAKEAGMHIGSDDDPRAALWWYPEVERFYAIASEDGRKAEREEIVELGEGYFYAESFLKAIRARGEVK